MSMNWPVTISRALPLLAVLFASAAPAETAGQPARPIVDCRSAATSFERSAGLPSGLLLAIGQIESGRTDPVTNRTDPWPWATNHAGEGHYFASAQEAIAWVTAQQAIGIRSIDVGCFQVNLHYHPDAFADLTEAFDPAANARYAAALLNRLHEQGEAGRWQSPSITPLILSRASDTALVSCRSGIRAAASPTFPPAKSFDLLLQSPCGCRRRRASCVSSCRTGPQPDLRCRPSASVPVCRESSCPVADVSRNRPMGQNVKITDATIIFVNCPRRISDVESRNLRRSRIQLS